MQVASLAYLPTAGMFVFDLTEECGTAVRDQLAIRRELTGRFPGKASRALTILPRWSHGRVC